MNATFKQRKYLFDLHRRLKWPVQGIRDLSVSEAQTAISKALKAIKQQKIKPTAKTQTDLDLVDLFEKDDHGRR